MSGEDGVNDVDQNNQDNPHDNNDDDNDSDDEPDIPTVNEFDTTILGWLFIIQVLISCTLYSNQWNPIWFYFIWWFIILVLGGASQMYSHLHPLPPTRPNDTEAQDVMRKVVYCIHKAIVLARSGDVFQQCFKYGMICVMFGICLAILMHGIVYTLGGAVVAPPSNHIAAVSKTIVEL
jgi:hypothetical protein